MDQPSRTSSPSPLPRLVLVAVLVCLAAGYRLLPEYARLPNAAPIGALALFAGFCLPYTGFALLAPLIALGVSDLFLGGYDVRVMVVVYLSYLVNALLGRLTRPTAHPLAVLGTALAGSIQFFLVTNFAVWYFALHDTTTLLQAYTDGLPFFRMTLLGDLGFAALFFGGFALLERGVPALREPAAA